MYSSEYEQKSPWWLKHAVGDYFTKNIDYWASIYEDPSGEDPSGEPSSSLFDMRKRKRKVLGLVDSHADGRSLRILDAGCGPGVLLDELRKRGHAIIGMDISGDAVKLSNARLVGDGKEGFRCVQADIEDIPLQDDSVDMVLCLGVLPWLAGDARGISEMSRVVRKGGVIILALPNLLRIGSLLDPYYYLFRVWQYFWHRLVQADGIIAESGSPTEDIGRNRTFQVRRYQPGSLNALFSRHNLTVSSSSGVEYGPLTFWRKEFLPRETSRSLGGFLDQISEKRGFSWLKALSGQLIICLEKL
jgi:SAM-dependent methyltransferase